MSLTSKSNSYSSKINDRDYLLGDKLKKNFNTESESDESDLDMDYFDGKNQTETLNAPQKRKREPSVNDQGRFHSKTKMEEGNQEEVDEEDEEYNLNDLNEEEDEEDDEEEDEDDDEEDDDDGFRSNKKKSRPKKKRKNINPFLELEAEVDDEEDDDEEEDFEDADFIEKDEDLPEISSDLLSSALSRRELDRRFVEQSDEQLLELAKDMDRRYKRTAIKPFRGDMAKTQQSLLPSVSDPKLWMVRCREGKEKNVVMTLMRKFFERQRQAMNHKNVNVLKIHSVFCRDDLKGFIYVEADLGQHIQDALKQVFGVYLGKTRLVPVKEMVDVLTIQKDHATVDLLKIEWVRVKRGKYAGDLARVVDMTESGDVCTVQLVPRLDVSQDGNKEKKKKKSNTLLSRPPQKLFNPRDLPPHLARLVSKSHRGYWTLGPDAFKNGLLEKSVRVSALDTECVPPPTLDEIKAFSGTEGTIDVNTLLTLKSSLANRESNIQFRPGDQVFVISGELANVPAVISGISGNLATIQALVPGLTTKTVLPITQLSKRFSIGDTVKVITGKHEGQIGTIVRLQGHLATLISTENQQELHVTTRDLQDVKEITSALGTHSITSLQPNSNSLHLSGKTELDDMQTTTTVTTTTNLTMNEPKRIGPAPRLYSDRPRKNPLLGATVKIQGGNFKGYLGIVKHLSDHYARVELHTNCKTISISKDRLSICDSSGTFLVPTGFPSSSSSSSSNRTPSISYTPSFSTSSSSSSSSSSSQTPNPYSSSSTPQTPHPYSSAQTPNPHSDRHHNDGFRTPAWDAGSRTPYHDSNQSAWSLDDPALTTTNEWGAISSSSSSSSSSATNAGTDVVAWGTEPSSMAWSAAGSGSDWKSTPSLFTSTSSSHVTMGSSQSMSVSAGSSGGWGLTPQLHSHSTTSVSHPISSTSGGSSVTSAMNPSTLTSDSNYPWGHPDTDSSFSTNAWKATPAWSDPRTPRPKDDSNTSQTNSSNVSGWGD